MRCPATERVESGGVGAQALVMDIKVQKPTSASWKLMVNPLPFNISARPLQPQHAIMVCTRKKDYGDAPPPKKRMPSSIRKFTIAVKGPDAVAETGLLYDTRGTLEKSRHNTQIPYTEFTLFQKLPCELRLMIWEASMTPRLVPVVPKSRRSTGRFRFPRGKKILPALFSVNKESRYCALRHYTLRFTIALTVDQTGLHKWDCPNFKGTTHRAHVLMSPDDTLGLIGWESLYLGHKMRFRVEKGNETSPWENYPINHGAEPEVKKVAFLGRDVAWDPQNFVHNVNSMFSWDLDLILHTKSTHARKLNAPSDSWYLWEAPSLKQDVLIQSRNFNGSVEDLGIWLMYRAQHWMLTPRSRYWTGMPDIFALKLVKKPE